MSAETNCWINHQIAGDLRRHGARCDAIVMQSVVAREKIKWVETFSWNIKDISVVEFNFRFDADLV